VSEHLVKESLTEVVKEKDLKVLSLPGVEGAKVVPGRISSFPPPSRLSPRSSRPATRGFR